MTLAKLYHFFFLFELLCVVLIGIGMQQISSSAFSSCDPFWEPVSECIRRRGTVTVRDKYMYLYTPNNHA